MNMSWEALAEGNTASNNNPVRVAELPKKVGEPIEKATPAPVTPAPVQTDAKVPEPVTLTSSDFISKFPGIAEEMKAQEKPPEIEPSSTFCAFVGHEGTGKTGLAMDAHFHKHPDGLAIVLDNDNGGLSCKNAHYNGNTNIRIFSPWVMQQEDTTAYNYLLSYVRTMEIAKFAVEYAERQTEPGFEGQLLKSFIVTGVDQFDEMCVNCMKIYDLDMKATDAVEASHAKLNSEIGWNWSIRSTRFKQLTAQCQKLNRLGVDVYWETHLKPDDGLLSHDGFKFVWEKSANKDLFQIIWVKGKPVRNNDGGLTGETRYTAKFYKSKTNPNLLNQERLYFVTKEGEDAQWYGLPELRDGVI
jgi:hypothetical protein